MNRFAVTSTAITAWVLCSLGLVSQTVAAALDLTDAVIVVTSGARPPAEKMAASILAEEVARRTGIKLPISKAWPTDDKRPVIAVTTQARVADWSRRTLHQDVKFPPPARSEAYAISIDKQCQGAPTVFVIGADARGAMFGTGRLLRELQWAKSTIKLDAAFATQSAPEYAARGHEMGYRARANSYDAWSPDQFEQYIREQIVFGMNCLQGIPFEDSRHSQHMQVSREEMNQALGTICARYDIDYWVWTPIEFSLTNDSMRQAELDRHERFYRSTPRLDAVFVPGGDPGDNPPELVLPFMEDLARLLVLHHPKAKLWISLQDFDEVQVRYVMDYVANKQPEWFGGVVADTSALSVRETRLQLPKNYSLRWYPDITHTVECRFPVSWWDPAYSVTLGREPTNPRPIAYTSLFRRIAPHTDGFSTYSDGINDDVNKAVWSMLGWDSQQGIREMLTQYTRFHFGAHAAQDAADGLIGLENNWHGGLADNAAVDGVLMLWQQLESKYPELLANWRFQQHLLRAYYDAYTRHRLIYEQQIERKALSLLGQAPEIGASVAINQAQNVIAQATSQPCQPKWRARAAELADALFESIGYQTSVDLYGASGAERGCVMDFIDRPLNDRWWLEQEFSRIRDLASEQEKLARIEAIRTWDEPGPGSYYDDVGNVARSPRVIRGEDVNTDPECRHHDTPGHSWVDDGRSRRRLAWLHHMRWPVGLDYDGLDPAATYV
ncbi:MAG: hypothetical protein KDA60_20155, partial [Planctomycetales bacterium]|nr:hypothetical protein [Planctomycetales bacterium]